LLAIDSPVDGASVLGRADLSLNAVSMGRDGMPLSITWNSDRDGELGTFLFGQDNIWNSLSVGTHNLTAEVTDTDGATATQTVSVTVSNNLPSATIVSPDNGETFGEMQAIPLLGVAADIDAFPTGQLADSQIRWSLSGNGFTATGANASIPAGRLGVGTYTLTMLADDGTDSAQESVTFSITPCTGSCPSASIIAPGNTVIRTSSRDDNDRIFVDVTFTGVAVDSEDGTFSGRVGDGPMRWTSTNEDGNVTNICTPIRLAPPLVPVETEQVCDSFTARFLLSDDINSTNQHLITLEVTDSDGNRSTDTIIVVLEFDLI